MQTWPLMQTNPLIKYSEPQELKVFFKPSQFLAGLFHVHLFRVYHKMVSYV